MMGFGWPELLIVLIIVVIVFGAGKLPELGKGLGRSAREFKAQASEDSISPGATRTDE